MSLLEIQDIQCHYDDNLVVDGLSFSVEKGHIAGLLGPSGCGKTTVLRAIAGFQPVSNGQIRIGDSVISRPGHSVPPERRSLGMMFQDYALFPHLSVSENITFGLKEGGRAEQSKHADELLEMVGLAGYGKRYPHELSGGQQQRVALARALAPRPELLLMDEPFSSLDVELRARLTLEIRDILKEQGITAILVTHDQQEAFAMCEQVGVMHGGHILQWDTPYQLYHEPNTRFVADFIGQGRFVRGIMVDSEKVDTELGEMPLHFRDDISPGSEVEVLLRPDDVLHRDGSPMCAQVLNKAFQGAGILYTLRLPTGSEILSLVPSHHNHAVGEHIGIIPDVEHVVVFPQSNAGNS